MSITPLCKKIGILIHNEANLFTNGITQNAYFIKECLESIGYQCVFLCSEQNPKPFKFRNIPLVQFTKDKTIFNPEDYFLIIYGTRRLRKDDYLYLKSHNVGVVNFVCGNHFIQESQDFVHPAANPTIGFSNRKPEADAFWIIPSFEFMIPYLEILRGAKGYVVPHLWTPMMLNNKYEETYKKPANSMIYNSFNKKRSHINIFVLESNSGFYKTALIPLVVTEKLNKLYPEIINKVYIYNFPTHDVSGLLSELTLGDKLVKCGRGHLEEIFETCNNNDTFPVFVSHHYKNSLNYLYYELLYYGYPLVHNSDDLDGCGYYYPDNNIGKCVEAIMSAYTHHNKQAETYREKALKYLERVDPYHPDVGKIWKQMIDDVHCGK